MRLSSHETIVKEFQSSGAIDALVEIRLSGRKIGAGQPCFIIAEAGVNHNGDVEIARQLIDVAKYAGTDAVKFQTFRAEDLATPTAPKAEYQLLATGSDESQLEMLRRLELSPEAHRTLMNYCQEQGILFLSTPFGEDSADFLADLGIVAFKIPSGEITNLPFLSHVARKGKPMILSTGMSSLAEVETAVRTIEETANRELVLLHCVSNYPANPADVNLRAMHTMAAAFGLPVGYSDHTMGDEVALAAVALGACVIEKHFTIDHSLPGPDQQASLEPAELGALVRGIRIVEASLGDGRKVPIAREVELAKAMRKSLVAARDIPVGAVLTEDMIAIKRPGTGLPPTMFSKVLGQIAKENIPEGALLSLRMLQ